MPEKAVVDADLMGPPGVEGAKDKRSAIFSSVEKVEISNRGLACSRVTDIHALTVHGMACDVIEDRLVGFGRRGLGYREVEFGRLSFRKLGDKALMGVVGFCHYDAAGGVLIESVYDARTFHSADSCELTLAVMKEGVDESAIRIPSRRVDDHAVGFVKDYEVVIFVDDFKREFLGDQVERFWLWNIDGNFISGLQGGFGFYLFGVQKDVATFYESLNARS